MQTKLSDFLKPATVIYEIHHLGADGVRWQAYVGQCPVTEFARLTDARRSQRIRELFSNPDFMAAAQITILAIETDPETIFNKFVNFYRPMLNPEIPFVEQMESNRDDRRRVQIECIETGIEYESVSKAAKDLGIGSPNLSRHLSTGKGTVGGYTFKRVE